MTDFLAKPLRKPALVAAVLRALRGGSGAAAAVRCRRRLPPAPLDLNVLSELTEEIGREQVNEMVALFFSETERRIALFRAVRRRRWIAAQLAIEAHSMKGGAARSASRSIAEIARAIELGSPIVSPEALDAQAGQLAKALSDLRRHCEGRFKLAS